MYNFIKHTLIKHTLETKHTFESQRQFYTDNNLKGRLFGAIIFMKTFSNIITARTGRITFFIIIFEQQFKFYVLEAVGGLKLFLKSYF